MHLIDIILILLLACAVILALRHIRRMRRSGWACCSGGCTGSCASCGADCPHKK